MMKTSFKVLFFVLLISCQGEKAVKIDKDIVKKTTAPVTEQKRIKKDTERLVQSCDSAYINKRWFRACFNSERVFVINDEGDTLYNEKEDIFNIKFSDFDQDGYKDMFIGYDGNQIVYELGLFDNKTNTFKLVENFSNLHEVFTLKGTQYYYSYSPGGCADLNWSSDLFYIKNYKVTSIARIKGIGCEGEQKNGIFISKIVDGKEKLIKTINRKPGYYSDKWDFIEKYWSGNYRRFTGNANHDQ